MVTVFTTAVRLITNLLCHLHVLLPLLQAPGSAAKDTA
jgi:hypothetical protein